MFLNCHTYYSLKYGTISPKDLLDEFRKRKVKTFALTDINNTSAILDVLRQTKDEDMKVVAGIDFRNGVQQQFIALAKNNDGF